MTPARLSAAGKHSAGLFVGGGNEPRIHVCCSVRLPALVFGQIQLLHLLLQKGNGHGASSGSLRQRVDLECKKDYVVILDIFKDGT